ncbi:hypothetical protein N7468_010439 [Penicillium chermesinum]|uniref:Uncharacterized protein n=1 Tax=Penicillium chermesinum TaxID=63820 RepID=A0A9W9TCG0_9EURO|nr:uncharacterized protein N7468_010439 [Penicillium chermesinum]KAJ5217431.1 hypothetical protein N7468_010439 [Penicillium chermesinum]
MPPGYTIETCSSLIRRNRASGKPQVKENVTFMVSDPEADLMRDPSRSSIEMYPSTSEGNALMPASVSENGKFGEGGGGGGGEGSGGGRRDRKKKVGRQDEEIYEEIDEDLEIEGGDGRKGAGKCWGRGWANEEEDFYQEKNYEN